jgi:hypothetical protein
VTPAPQPGTPTGNDPSSIQQQRAAQRSAKLDAYHRQQKRGIRTRRIALIAGGAVVLAVVALVVSSVVLSPKKAAEPAAGAASAIAGVHTFANKALHVETKVTYPQTPPAGGEHSPVWLDCGVYTQPVPNENAVHSLEHGAIWVTYDPSLPAADLAALRAQLPSTYAILSPYVGLPSPIVLSGWNVQLQLQSATDKRIPEFFKKYWQGGTAPEPGSPCTGALDAPGKVS